jgi:hypothetical protein
MHTPTLIKRLTPPTMDQIAIALYKDAAQVGEEYAKGDELSMISAQSVARNRVPEMLMRAAIIALMADGDNAMAEMLAALLKGRKAGAQWCNRDWQTGEFLEEAAASVEEAGAEIAERFRKGAEGLAA